MKSFRIMACFSLIALTFLISGCGGSSSGGGGLNLNGSLTMSTPSGSAAGDDWLITFTVAYTNPQKSNLLGTPIDLYINGIYVETINTNNSGSFTRGYTFGRSTTSQVVYIAAKTGDLEASQIAIIPATSVPSLTINPSTLTFSALSSSKGTTQFSFISGGTLPYSVQQLTGQTDIFARYTTVASVPAVAVTKISYNHSASAQVEVIDSTLPTALITPLLVNY